MDTLNKNVELGDEQPMNQVDKQTGVRHGDTDGGKNPFAKRGLIRTAPQAGRNRTYSFPECRVTREEIGKRKRNVVSPGDTEGGSQEVIDLVEGEDANHGSTRPAKKLKEATKERKKAEACEEEINRQLEKLRGTVRELNTLTKENPNTKKEIKRAVEDLKGHVDTLDRKMDKKIKLTMEMREIWRDRGVSRGTQTELKKDRKKGDEERCRKLEDRIREQKTLGDMIDVAMEEWPEAVFNKTKQMNNSIWSRTSGGNKMILFDVEKDREHPLMKRVIEAQPQIEKPIKDGMVRTVW